MAFSDAMIGSNDFDPQAATEDMLRSTMGPEPLPPALDPRMLRTRLMRKLNEPVEEPKLSKTAKSKQQDLDFSNQAVPTGQSESDDKNALDFTAQVTSPPPPAPAPSVLPSLHDIHANIDPYTALKGAAAGVATGAGGVLQGLGTLGATAKSAAQTAIDNAFGHPKTPEQQAQQQAATIADNPAIAAGKATKGLAPAMTPEEEGSIAGRTGKMAGAIAPYAAATLIGGPALGIAAGFSGMAADTYGSTYEHAKSMGATDEVAQGAATKSALVAGVLGSLPLGAGKYAATLAGKVISSSAAFATAGEAQEAILKQIEKDYDPKAGYSLDQKRLIAELILGAGMGGLHHAFEPEKPQPQPGPQPNAGGLPPGGQQRQYRTNPDGSQTSWSNPPGGGPSGNSGTGPDQGSSSARSGAGPQPGPQGGPQPGGARAEPSKPPPGTGEGVGPEYTMDPKVRAKMEKVYRAFNRGSDPAGMSDADLFNAVNEHMRDTSSTGYTAKEETAEEKGARESTARKRDEDTELKGAFAWMTDAQLNSMTPAMRDVWLQRARGAKPGKTEQPKTESARPEAAPEEPSTPLKPNEEGPAAGTREAPIVARTADDIVAALPAEPKSPAQAEAENYRHAHVELPQFGLEGKHSISIETGVGQERKGVDADGKPWSITMEHGAYGRLKGTMGADGQPLDAFIGPHPASPYAFVIDQHDPKTGAFDEHKIMLGYRTPIDALHAYAHSYDDAGKDRIGHMVAMGPEEFKAWRQGDTTKPLKPKGEAATVPVTRAETGTVEPPLTKTAAEGADTATTKVSPASGGSESETTRKPSGSKAQHQPLSLLQFIASKGGLEPHPELSALDLSGAHRVQIPGRKGFFGIVRPNGAKLDTMREAAEEAGYLRGDINRTSTVKDLLDAIDNELRGQRHGAEGEEGVKSKREEVLEAEREEHEKERQETHYGDHYRAIDAEYPGTPSDLKHAAANLMAEGHDVDSAIERAAERLVAKEDTFGETPDDFDATYGVGSHDETQRESAHGNGEAPARAGEEARRPGEGEEDRSVRERIPTAGAESEEAGRDAGRVEPTTEKGADNKQQTVIPGAEKASDKTMAQRAAAAPLKPKVAQKGMEVGLFGDERNQSDIFDHIKTVEKALGKDAAKVAPVDIARAGEIMVEKPGIETAAAFGQAVIENAANQDFLTPAEIMEAYGEKAKELLEPGREGPSGSGAHAVEAGAAPDEERAGGAEENRELPGGGEVGEGGKPETAAATEGGEHVPVAETAKRPAARGKRAARNKADNAPANESAAEAANEPERAKPVDDFDDIFDKALDEQFAPKPMALDEVAKGLQGIFGKKLDGLSDAEVPLDDATYQRALPYLKAGVEHFAGEGVTLPTMVRALVQHLAGAGMDADAIRAMKPYIRRFTDEVLSGKETINAPSSGEVLEPGGGDTAARDRMGEADVSPAAGGAGQGTVERGDEISPAERPPSGERVSEDYAPAVGEDGTLQLPPRESGPEDRDAADREHPGGGPDREEGFSFDEQSDEDAIRNAQKDADLAARRAAQAAANAKRIKHKDSSPSNIAESLPMLFPEQQADVLGAEQRFHKTSGHGMLMTNGTGTGKTYSGLGVIKRFQQQGKNNTIVIAPSQGILEDWVRSARDLGIEMSVLKDTMDKGRGIVATTYANFGANRSLVDREWDLVVADEAHKLSSDQEGTTTEALRTLRALTYHPDGLRARAEMILRKELDNLNTLPKGPVLEKARGAVEGKIRALVDEWKDRARNKALFLSATPFAYHFSLDWAEGYLFNYDRSDDTKGGYNAGDGRDKFYMQHLGYRMRTNKLTKPEAEVDQGIMERQLHEYLRKEGSLSGRVLTVDKDYDRKFVLAHDAIGEQIDRALDFLQENEQFRPLMDYVGKKFDYLSRMRLLEAMKARSAVPFIQKSFDLGRKVVVFHDYNEGGGINPFDLTFPEGAKASRYVDGKHEDVPLQPLYEDFIRQNPYVKTLKFADYRPPIEELTKAFPNALIYNGTVSKKDRSAAKALFNDDNSGRNLIIVQSAAGEAGISLHDTTGKHQRTLLNLGMPIRPVSSIQQEGRIYRVGQASDALFRYMNTGTNWERWTFAGKIADRAGTAENLALGNQARAIRQSFIDSFGNSGDYEPEPGEGTGGKEADKALSTDLSEFQKAKTHYWAQRKIAGRRDQREGSDYYATPEPLGLKMVEWADIKPGEKVLEPSAGHGAIARYFPENTARTLVEPSSSLASRASLQSPGARTVVDRFENLDVGANKFDAIVMNPPFGTAGKTAIDHIAKAVKHLKNGGRIVALIPRGSTDAKFKKFMDSDASKDVYLVGRIELPPVTFERAGTQLSARVVVLEKQTDPEARMKLQSKDRDYSNADTIGDFFDRIEHSVLPDRIEPLTKDIDQPTAGRMTVGGVEFNLPPLSTGGETYADIKNRLGKPLFARVARIAEANGGRYLNTLKSFSFPDLASRSKFLDDMAKPEPEKPAGESMTWTNGETTHAKNGMKLFVATPNERVPRETFDQMSAAAKREGGYYSSYNSRGAIPGFQFTSQDARQRFLQAMNPGLADTADGTDFGPPTRAQFTPDRSMPIAASAQRDVLQFGAETGREKLISIGPDGDTPIVLIGNEKGVSFTPELTHLLETPGSDLVVHHNHPSGRALSGPDFAQFGYPGLNSIWAHGSSGYVYRGALTQKAASVMPLDFEKARNTLYQTWNAVSDALHFDVFQPYHAEHPELTDDLNMLAGHLTNRAFRDAGIIEYDTNYSNDPLERAIPHLSAKMAQIADILRRNLFSENARYGNDRYTFAPGHVGNVGVSLDRRALVAGQRSQAANAGARGEVRRPQTIEPEDEGVGGTQPRLLDNRGGPILGAFGDHSKVIKAFKQFWTSTFQPELVSDRALMADPLFAKYKSSQANEKDAIVRQSEKEWNYWNKRGIPESIRFIDDVETAGFGAIPSDPVQAAMARRYRAMLDANWALEKQWGSQAAFVQDYFPHIWEKPAKWRAFAEARSAQMGPTWFQKKRTIDYITDGLAFGLKLKYTNPVDIIVHRLLSGVDMRQRMQLLYALKDEGLAWNTTQGQQQLMDRGWQLIVAPDRKQWVIHPDGQPLWKNAVEAKGLWQDEALGGSMFRGWMALKNAYVPVKLALSAFHPLHVLHINFANGMARGWDLLTKDKDPMGALKAVAKGFTDPLVAAPGASIGALLGTTAGYMVGMPGWGGIAGTIAGSAAFAAGKRMGLVHDVQTRAALAKQAWQVRPNTRAFAALSPQQKLDVQLMNDGGFVPQLSEQLKIGAKRQLAVAFQKVLRREAKAGDYWRLIHSAMRRSMEIMQAPIFERWIPQLKTAAYLDAASDYLKRQPLGSNSSKDHQLALRAIAKSIDNRFGEMFYGNLFWDRYLKDTAIGSFLSLGWNLGFVREFLGAAFETISRPLGLFPAFKPSAPRKVIRQSTNKIAFAIAYLASAALINGIMTKLYTGENPEGLDFIFARIGGQNPDMTPRRITNMFYLREVPMLVKHIQERGGNVVTGTGEMIYNKMMIEPFRELLNNRDYYGYNIWDENAPFYKQFGQAMYHTIVGEGGPMSVSGGKHAAELSGKPFPSFSESMQHPDRLLDALKAKGVDMSLLGFGPAPAYVEKSGIQNRISYLYGEHVAPASKPHSDEENSHEKLAVRTAIMIAKRDHDSSMMNLARERGRAIGLTPGYMSNIGKTPTDVYLFSRLPVDDQKSLLRGASPEEQQRYLPHANQKLRIEFNRARYAPQPQGNPNEART